MADNVEIKIEQLTDAIRSLYSRPALSHSEISNLMTSLSQKFETSSDTNIQKLTGIFANETKKVFEEKNHELKEQLYSFENLLKQVSTQTANPKLSMEVSKILSEVTTIFTKLSNQELALQKINQGIASSKSINAGNEIIKLANDFAAFSRGFDNITTSLNKNFAEFLDQVKAFSSKEELAKIQIELDTISGNINSVISALAIIDHKYQDLTGLIDVINRKEGAFNDSLNEIRQFAHKADSLQESIRELGSKEDIRVLSEKLNLVNDYFNSTREKIDEALNQNNRTTMSFVGTIEEKLSSAVNSGDLERIKLEMQELSNRLVSQNEVNKEDLLIKLKDNFTNIKAQSDKEIEEQLYAHTNGVNEGINYISSQIGKIQESFDTKLAEKTAQIDTNVSTLKEKLDFVGQNIEKLPLNDLSGEINIIKDNLKAFGANFSILKDEIAQINSGNLRAVQEPIERALKDLREVTIGPQLSQINENVKETTKDLSQSINQIKENFNSIASNSNVETLSAIKDMIPALADKLEGFRENVITQNNVNINELKSSFYEVSETIKAYLEDTTYKVQEEIKKSYDESLSAIKLDLQTLSNHLIESVENVNSNISREFESHKNNIDELLARINDNENLNTQALSQINENLQINLEELKNDIVNGILGSSKSNKTSFGLIEEKVNKILAYHQSSEFENKDEALLDALNTVSEKVERTNLQQIHNAKELMEEIQSAAADVLKKLDYSNEVSPNVDEILSKLSSLEEKITDTDLKESIQTTVKENFEQILDLLKKDEPNNNEPDEPVDIPQVNSYLAKIDEYLTNIDYLKNNMSADVRECIESQIMELGDKFESAMNAKNEEFKAQTLELIDKILSIEADNKKISEDIERVSSDIAKIVSSNEDESSYTYSLQDVESDITKMRLSLDKNLKGDNYKEFINRLIELKNINIENNKLNHLVEGHISRLNGWLKNTSSKLEDLSAQVEQAQTLSMEEVKTRLIKSERTIDTSRIDSYLENLDSKLNVLLQKPDSEFDPAQFIDVTYDNMKQTKNLMLRVDTIENKIDKIQGYMEKIIAYIEE